MRATDKHPDEVKMSISEHLEELRRRLIYALLGLAAAMAVALVFAPEIIAVLKTPYTEAMKDLGRDGDLVVLKVTSGLANYLKVSFYAGLVLGAPWIFHQLWMFVAGGLHEHEKRYVRLAVPFCALLFVGGALFFLLFVSQRIVHYLLVLTEWLGMVPMITFASHIGFMLRMMIVFGLAFQTPLAILVLAGTGLVSIKTLHHYRRHVIVGILVLAATLTPPDPLSMVVLAVPVWVLYELGVLLAYFFVWRKRRLQS